MSKTVRTETRKTSVWVVFFFVIFIILLLAGFLFAVKSLNPELWSQVFPPANETLIKENQNLKTELNNTQIELGQTKSELFQSKSQKILWSVVIGIIAIAILLIIVWTVWIKPKDRALTVDEFEKKFLSIVREKFDFSKDDFVYHKFVPKTVERKEFEGNSTDELTYYGEFSFYKRGEENLYVHGIHSPKNQTVTVAITNKSWRYRQKWYEWMWIDEAMKLAAAEERVGHALQKSRIKSDIEDALAGATNIAQLKDAFGNSQEQSND